MDQLTHYRALLERILKDWASLANRRASKEVETHCVFDEERNHYLVLNLGWSGDRRVRDATVYARLRNGKIWIEEDWTEEGITKDLLKAGVPKEDIVLAFQHPTMRPLTEFAVA
jgi:hypothetical protein